MPRADQATIEYFAEYFAVMEARDYDRLGEYFADEVTLTFANAPTVDAAELAWNGPQARRDSSSALPSA
jgi:hypothetical protein